ncbi:popC protein [Nymphaea thermarum]|nr:popC protein [Nymphaea thermarum]
MVPQRSFGGAKKNAAAGNNVFDAGGFGNYLSQQEKVPRPSELHLGLVYVSSSEERDDKSTEVHQSLLIEPDLRDLHWTRRWQETSHRFQDMVLALPKPTSTIVIFTFLSVVSVTVAISWLRRSKTINRSHVGRISVSEAQKPSPPPPKGHGFEFDVFLSFRGEDTRKTFTELLYDGLEMQGIHTFKDDKKLKKGERVESLLDAIDKSKIFVPILSKNYADSRWCLMEIAKIVSSGRLIIPVFFDVDPSDIRRQKGPFEAAFRKHEGNKELTERTVDEWRDALRKVGEISGYDLKNETDGQVFATVDHNLSFSSAKSSVKEVMSSFLSKFYAYETRNETEGIFLYLTSQWKRHLYLSTKAFSTMPKLRMLNLNFSKFQECDLQHFPRKLKWLEWRACPLESLTWDGNLLDLVVLDLSHSKVKQIWNEKTLNMELRGPLQQGSMVFRRLKVLNLSCCSSLVATPDFACVPCLVKLILDTCYHLLEIDESVECLEDLVYLSMQWCLALTELPTGVTKLGSLEILNLSNCQNIWALPERVGEMESLTEMCLDSTKIRKLPESIVELSNLCKLSLKKCASLEELPHCIGRLESLQVINLERTAVTRLPDSIGELKSLNQLSLKGCKLLELPDSIGQLESLRDLIVDGAFLMSIPDSIGNLNSLHWLSLEGHELIESALSSTETESPEETITWCNLITRLPDSIGHLRNLHQLCVDGCPSLVELPDAIGSLETLEVLTLTGTKVRKLPGSIGELKNLYMLSLKDSELLEELPQSIGNLESLRELILDRCTSLRDIPDSIRYLQNLSQLSLKECKSLEEVPDSFENLKCLKELILEGTSLRRLPNSIEGLKNLIQLSLNGSDLFEELPDSIGRLESLKELNLDSTRIRNLPESIVHLKNLNQLSLCKCGLLEEIPESIGELKSLESIMVDECGRLRSLPDSVGLLERLETLSMNGLMDMRVLPSSMGKLKSLLQLNISNTGIREMFHEFGGLTKLKTIDLSNNPELIALPSSFFQLSSLEKLVAHGCNWLEGVDATCFGKLPSLKILDLSHSGFCSIPSSVRRLSLLEELILEDCKRIQSLPRLPPSLCTLNANGCTALESISDIPKLKGLNNLNLRGCRKLTSLCGLERLKYLTCLYMNGCESLGADIMESLSKASFKYLEVCQFSGSLIQWSPEERKLLFGIPESDQELVHLNVYGRVSSCEDQNGGCSTIPVHIEVMGDDQVVFRTTREALCNSEHESDGCHHSYQVSFESEDNKLDEYLRKGFRKIWVSTTGDFCKHMTGGDVMLQYNV